MANKFKTALAKAQESGKRALAKRRNQRGNIIEKGSAIATGFGLGRSKDAEWFQSIPRPFGVPRTVIIAGAAMFLGSKVKGDVGTVLEGVGTGAAVVAGYQWGAREEVSGAGSERSLRARIARELGSGDDDLDDEVAGYEQDVVAV